MCIAIEFGVQLCMIIVDTQNNSDLKYEAQTPSGCKVIAILVDHQKVLLLVGTPEVLVF